MNITVIGDIHGCYKTFLALLDKIPKDDTIVLCGDLVDRGPNSKDLVQYVIDNKILCVKGNHEDMMVKDVLGEKTPYEGAWLSYEGIETLRSYKREDGLLYNQLLRIHSNWMEHLPLYLEFPEVKNESGRYLVVSHSSIGSTWNFKDKTHPKHYFFDQDVLWGRNPPKDIAGIYNVFGHTPNQEPKVKSFYANIDTGCVFNRSGYTKLTALRFPSMEIVQQENIDVDNIQI